MVKFKSCHCRNISSANCWEIRNNSTNVAAILHPQSYSTTDSVYENHRRTCLSDNTCYCREKKLQPTLFAHPKGCLRQHEKNPPPIKHRTNTITIDTDYATVNDNFTIPSRSLEKQLVEIQEDVPTIPSKFKHRETDRGEFSNDVTSASFQHPNSRKFSNDVTSASFKHPNRKFSNDVTSATSLQQPNSRKFSNDVTNASSNHPNSRKFNDGVTGGPLKHVNGEFSDDITQYQNDSKSGRASEDVTNNDDDSRLKQLSDFRKDHYFDTHSVADLIDDGGIPEHTCVHRFGLDDRYLPMALNGDPYGVSRCIICNKPMGDGAVSTRDERQRVDGVFPKFYQYGMAPKRIYMGGGDVKIEMVVEGEKCAEFSQYLRRNRPNYHDTYALRYQKGVVI